MQNQLGTLSADTKEAIHRMVFSVKEAHDKFHSCYQSALTDVSPGWDKEWKKWDSKQLGRVVGAVHNQMKPICVSAGMTPKTWMRYQRAAVNATFLGIPFSFGTSITVKEIGKVRELTRTKFTKGTEEERAEAACKEIQKQRNKVTATHVLRDRVIVVEPDESEDLLTDLTAQLANYLSRPDVLAQLDPLDLINALRKQVKRPNTRKVA